MSSFSSSGDEDDEELEFASADEGSSDVEEEEENVVVAVKNEDLKINNKEEIDVECKNIEEKEEKNIKDSKEYEDDDDGVEKKEQENKNIDDDDDDDDEKIEENRDNENLALNKENEVKVSTAATTSQINNKKYYSLSSDSDDFRIIKKIEDSSSFDSLVEKHTSIKTEHLENINETKAKDDSEMSDNVVDDDDDDDDKIKQQLHQLSIRNEHIETENDHEAQLDEKDRVKSIVNDEKIKDIKAADDKNSDNLSDDISDIENNQHINANLDSDLSDFDEENVKNSSETNKTNDNKTKVEPKEEIIEKKDKSVKNETLNDKLMDDKLMDGKLSSSFFVVAAVEPVSNMKEKDSVMTVEVKNTVKLDEKQVKLESNVSNTQSNIQTSGWDDTEFSDIDDNELSDNEDQVVVNKNENFEQKIKNKEFQDEELKQQQQQTKVVEQPPKQQQQATNSTSSGGGWSWSKFGSVFSTVTAQLGDGLNTMIGTVEASLGAPDPLELARKTKHEKEILKEIEETTAKSEMINEESNVDNSKKDEFLNSWDDHGDWFPINKLATSVVTGGLDVLEKVGKKTIEVISDKDPNLKQTREFIKKAATVTAPVKPNLSQLLREAQEESEKNENTNKSKQAVSGSKSDGFIKSSKDDECMNFTTYFDEYKGQVHLEALEMLSRQSIVKYEMQILSVNEKRVNTIIQPLKLMFNVDELSDDTDDDNNDEEFDLNNFEDIFIDYMSELNIKLPIDKVVQSYKTASFACKEISSLKQLYNESVKCFALITATIVEFFHKIAESLLIQQQNNTNKRPNYMAVHRAENLSLMTKLCLRSNNMIANDFCKKFKTLNHETLRSNNQTVTNILLEASNGNTYIGDAFALLSPIFKCLLLDESNING